MSEKQIFKTAIGLSYKGRDQETPKVSVKEENLNADEVIKIAKRYGVPVVERSEMASALKSLELDQEIPEEMFEAVALLINEVEQKTGENKRKS